MVDSSHETSLPPPPHDSNSGSLVFKPHDMPVKFIPHKGIYSNQATIVLKDPYLFYVKLPWLYCEA